MERATLSVSFSPFLRHTLHVFRGEFSTTLLSPLEPVQIVILANWIEILTIRIVLTKCNTIMPIHTILRNTFLQKCQLLFFLLPFFHNNFIFQTNYSSDYNDYFIPHVFFYMQFVLRLLYENHGEFNYTYNEI